MLDVTIRLKENPEVQHVFIPFVANQYIATGFWEKVPAPGDEVKAATPGTVQTAAIVPQIETAAVNRRVNFHVGPRSPRPLR
jgi:hypothetical protein